MGLIGGQLGYQLLRMLARRVVTSNHVEADRSDVALRQLFGGDSFESIQGRTIIDFGCGPGHQSVKLALRGAGQVIGLDIQERLLAIGRELAARKMVSDRCTFVSATDQLADVIISTDAFEHFADPAEILRLMAARLKPDGHVLAAFGPTWLHPYGGHLFSVFPWAHLIFTEAALIRWRSEFKFDGATRFAEIDGGLNQLTIARFEALVAASPLRFEWLKTVPIRRIRAFEHKALREFGSSIVRCKLVLR